jgi:predicted RNA-binding protein YlxR (DUF448 family)
MRNPHRSTHNMQQSQCISKLKKKTLTKKYLKSQNKLDPNGLMASIKLNLNIT